MKVQVYLTLLSYLAVGEPGSHIPIRPWRLLVKNMGQPHFDTRPNLIF